MISHTPYKLFLKNSSIKFRLKSTYYEQWVGRMLNSAATKVLGDGADLSHVKQCLNITPEFSKVQ